MNPCRLYMSRIGKAGIPLLPLQAQNNGFSGADSVRKCKNRQQSLTNLQVNLILARFSAGNNPNGLLQFMPFKIPVQKLTNWNLNALLVQGLAGNIPSGSIGPMVDLFCYKPPFAEINKAFTETNGPFAETTEYQRALPVYLSLYYTNS